MPGAEAEVRRGCLQACGREQARLGPRHRACQAGKLVDGSSATCSELEKIIRVDKEAIRYELDKLEVMPNDPEQKKIVADAEKAIEAQIVKLNAKRREKSCFTYLD